ncbi:hypothetical protein ACEWPM_002690 [Roseovarius sp. S4756]|uniref:hypothetical protein n=1 Tax=Roseovarius maritimus TaxID=3342637 RepID=UPI003728B0ED
MDDAQRRVRCYAFFTAVRVLHSIARGVDHLPNGKTRVAMFSFGNDVDLEAVASNAEQAKVHERGLVQKYLNTFGGFDPDNIATNPVFVADKGICMEAIGAAQ